MFDLVADVERYPEFLPWCLAVRRTHAYEDGFRSEMVVGFKVYRETFATRVHLHRPDRIVVDFRRGPFKHLHNHWLFEDVEGGCRVDFAIDFEFRSRILEGMMGAIFGEAVRAMVTAFENRAKALYEFQQG